MVKLKLPAPDNIYLKYTKSNSKYTRLIKLQCPCNSVFVMITMVIERMPVEGIEGSSGLRHLTNYSHAVMVPLPRDRLYHHMTSVGTATDRAKSLNSPATTYGARIVRTWT